MNIPYPKKNLLAIGFVFIMIFLFGFFNWCHASPDLVATTGIKSMALPFKDEELTYTVKWSNFINAGNARLIFSPGLYKGDQPVLTARTIAKSAKWMKVLGIDVEDRIETFFDPNFRFSYFFHADIKETDYTKTKTIIFDWDNHLVEYTRRQEKPVYFNLKENTHDVLSALYYVRTLPLKAGESFYVNVFDDGKEYLLEIKVLAREDLNIQEELIPALKAKILLKTEGIFNRKGDVYVWFSDDSKKIPIQMRCDIFLGFFHVELVNARAYFHYR